MTSRLAMLAMPAALLAACAGAPPTGLVAPPPSFALVDADGDGAIIPEEWETFGAVLFVSLDADGDDRVGNREMRRGYAAFDADRDGRVTADEVDMPLIDTDRDGVITETEWHDHLIVDGIAFERDGTASSEAFRLRRRLLYTTLDRDANGRIDALDLHEDAPGFTTLRL